jgi:hypothetical protein
MFFGWDNVDSISRCPFFMPSQPFHRLDGLNHLNRIKKSEKRQLDEARATAASAFARYKLPPLAPLDTYFGLLNRAVNATIWDV